MQKFIKWAIRTFFLFKPIPYKKYRCPNVSDNDISVLMRRSVRLPQGRQAPAQGYG